MLFSNQCRRNEETSNIFSLQGQTAITIELCIPRIVLMMVCQASCDDVAIRLTLNASLPVGRLSPQKTSCFFLLFYYI